MRAFTDAVRSNDTATVRRLLTAHGAELKPMLENAITGCSFGETALIVAVRARNHEMIDALLDAGADINGRSKWWAGGFGVFDEAAEDPGLVQHLIERGAIVDVHAAARLGKLDHLRMLLSASPSLVHSRGGDGMLPLHFASSLEIARYLVEGCGAPMDAIDVDHESTAAQYMVRDRQEIARYLVSRGCKTDILLGAALGEAPVVERHLDAIRTRVSNQWFPMQDSRAGGSIYIWTLGQMKTPHQVARDFGQEAIFEMLLSHSSPSLRLAIACEVGDPAPNGVAVDEEDYPRIVVAAKGNSNGSVRRMLESGWPVATMYDGASALHWAAFHGNAELVQLLLSYQAPTRLKDSSYDGTPLDWAQHGSIKSWNRSTGDYSAVRNLLASHE